MKKFLRHRFIVERLRMKPHSYEDLIRALEKSEEYFIVWNIHLDIFKVQVVEYTHFIEDKNTSRKDKISWRYF